MRCASGLVMITWVTKMMPFPSFRHVSSKRRKSLCTFFVCPGASFRTSLHLSRPRKLERFCWSCGSSIWIVSASVRAAPLPVATKSSAWLWRWWSTLCRIAWKKASLPSSPNTCVMRLTVLWKCTIRLCGSHCCTSSCRKRSTSPPCTASRPSSTKSTRVHSLLWPELPADDAGSMSGQYIFALNSNSISILARSTSGLHFNAWDEKLAVRPTTRGGGLAPASILLTNIAGGDLPTALWHSSMMAIEICDAVKCPFSRARLKIS
mmetsp:Transcript_30290/g.85434  ORF Transcript_30290/g.85434 Transcript_30290/m.85434 type:complete len:264 (-) Transcript_30290:394-1185(-)